MVLHWAQRLRRKARVKPSRQDSGVRSTGVRAGHADQDHEPAIPPLLESHLWLAVESLNNPLKR